MIKICTVLLVLLVAGIYANQINDSDEKEQFTHRYYVEPSNETIDRSEKQKIVGGSYAGIGEFPYQVSLRVNGEHICGGALITPKHVLTAAHCIYAVPKDAAFHAVVGTNSIRYGGEFYRVIDAIPHPNYIYRENHPTWFYDIGVLILENRVSSSNRVQLVKAPTYDQVAVNSVATVSGWGCYAAGSPSVQDLQKLSLKIIDTRSCQQGLGRYRIDDSLVCTFLGQGQGTCNGDSGGPLVQNGELIGIVSGGIPCAIGYPDVFTKVYRYLGFIQEIVNATI